MKSALVKAGLLAATTILLPATTYAAPIACFSTVPADVGASDTDDVTLQGSDATACEIVDSQNSGQGGGSFGATSLGSGWTELFNVENSVTSDNTSVNGVTFSNYTFTPLPPGGSSFSGTFGFNWSY